MGQRIFYIVTDINIEIPKDIVHFREFDSIIIPIPVEEFDEIQDFFENITSLNLIHWNLYSKIDFQKADEHFCDRDRAKLLKWFFKVKLKTFAIYGYREVFDMPQNIGEPILFFEGTRISDIKIFDKLTNNLFKYNPIVRNEEKYWHYWLAKDIYYDRNV